MMGVSYARPIGSGFSETYMLGMSYQFGHGRDPEGARLRDKERAAMDLPEVERRQSANAPAQVKANLRFIPLERVGEAKTAFNDNAPWLQPSFRKVATPRLRAGLKEARGLRVSYQYQQNANPKEARQRRIEEDAMAKSEVERRREANAPTRVKAKVRFIPFERMGVAKRAFNDRAPWWSYLDTRKTQAPNAVDPTFGASNDDQGWAKAQRSAAKKVKATMKARRSRARGRSGPEQAR